MLFRSLSVPAFSASHEKLRAKLDFGGCEIEVFNLQGLRHIPNVQQVAGKPFSCLSAIAVNKMINLYSSLSPSQMHKS